MWAGVSWPPENLDWFRSAVFFEESGPAWCKHVPLQYCRRCCSVASSSDHHKHEKESWAAEHVTKLMVKHKNEIHKQCKNSSSGILRKKVKKRIRENSWIHWIMKFQRKVVFVASLSLYDAVVHCSCAASYSSPLLRPLNSPNNPKKEKNSIFSLLLSMIRDGAVF